MGSVYAAQRKWLFFFGDGSRECVDKTVLHYFLIHGSYIRHGYL